eukprot:Hpha_TRINITY_DN23544_c0_g1::TRINITY_DN23544_c0_g1_i1::g.186440::m.186440
MSLREIAGRSPRQSPRRQFPGDLRRGTSPSRGAFIDVGLWNTIREEAVALAAEVKELRANSVRCEQDIAALWKTCRALQGTSDRCGQCETALTHCRSLVELQAERIRGLEKDFREAERSRRQQLSEIAEFAAHPGEVGDLAERLTGCEELATAAAEAAAQAQRLGAAAISRLEILAPEHRERHHTPAPRPHLRRPEGDPPASSRAITPRSSPPRTNGATLADRLAMIEATLATAASTSPRGPSVEHAGVDNLPTDRVEDCGVLSRALDALNIRDRARREVLGLSPVGCSARQVASGN